MQAKECINSFIKGLIEERRDRENIWTDMLGTLLAAKDDPEAPKDVKDLDEDAVLDNLVGMWFGFYETTSATLVWILKFLAEYPEVCRRVQVCDSSRGTPQGSFPVSISAPQCRFSVIQSK